jgi:WD40 repeat protein
VQVRGRIGAFAQDGDRIAWLWPDGRCDQLIQVRRLSTGVQRGVASRNGPTCRRNAYVPVLALAGTRAMWAIFWQSHTEDHIEVVTGSVTERRDVIAGKLTFGGGVEERPRTHFIPVAGDGSTLVYADVDDGSETFDRGVRRLIGRSSVRIPGVIGAISLAASGRRLALLSDTSATSVGSVWNSEAAWSPLGDRIAYSSTPEGDFRFAAIKIIGADGASPRKITNQTLGEYRADYTPDWSPDGSRLAFTRREVSTDSNRSWIWTMNTDGSDQRKLTRGSEPAWSPDGMKIAFTRETGGVSVINTDGSGLRDLTSDFSGGPDWSPDGSMLAFWSSTPQSPFEVRVMNSDGTNVHDVTAGLNPGWSADGRIAFTRGPDPSEVRVVNPDGSNDHRIADGLDPSWSPDSARLAITRANSKNSSERDIFVINANSSAETRLTTAKLEPIAPTLQLRDVRSGRMIARIAYRGQGKGISLSPSFAAVLARDETGTHVALYNARDGSAVGVVPVPGNANDLSISGTRVVFRGGRSIWMFDARRKHVSLLATAKATPIGLSIEGRRVAWAENLRGRGRVRALTLR